MDSVPLVALDEVDSTIAEAERRLEAGGRAPFVVSAKSQTAGRGRFGRTWASPPGNLYWTIALEKPPGWPADHGLTFAAGLAVGDALAASGIEQARLRLKWPNDVLVDGRKISGVLVKSSGGQSKGEKRAHVVVGIGVNVVSYPEDSFFPATSLAAAGVPETGIERLREGLTRAFLVRLSEWQAGGFPALRPDYEMRLYGVGQVVRIATDRDRTRTVEGINRGIDVTGALGLELSTGELRLISAGDVLAPA